MTFTGITATEAQIDQKSGENVATTFTSTMKTESLLMAEGWLNGETEFNWSDKFSSLNVDVKSLITNVTASLVAIDAINYDASGYTTQLESQTMLDVLNDIVQRGTKTLRIKSKQGFITGA